MACRGVHFALREDEVLCLRSFSDDQERLAHLSDVIEEEYFSEHPEFVAKSDHAWDAMHRALADGMLSWDGGVYPLNHVVLAGELLYSQPDYIMSLKSAAQVRDIAQAVAQISEIDFRRRYQSIDAENYGVMLSVEDFQYTWTWFLHVRDLYSRAAEASRPVLFTVDQ